MKSAPKQRPAATEQNQTKQTPGQMDRSLRETGKPGRAAEGRTEAALRAALDPEAIRRAPHVEPEAAPAAEPAAAPAAEPDRGPLQPPPAMADGEAARPL